MPLPIIVYGIGLGIGALVSALGGCDEEPKVRRDDDPQDAGEDAALPPAPPPPPPIGSTCLQPSQVTLSPWNNILLACANPGRRFEILKEAEGLPRIYEAPEQPPHPIPDNMAVTVHNFAIAEDDGLIWVLTRYWLEDGSTIRNILYSYNSNNFNDDSPLEEAGHEELLPTSTDPFEFNENYVNLLGMQWAQNRFSGETYLDVYMQGAAGLFLIRGPATYVIDEGRLEEDRFITALSPVRIEEAYSDPLIFVTDASLRVHNLSNNSNDRFDRDFVHSFSRLPGDFHPTPTFSISEEDREIPLAPYDLAFENLGSTNPWRVAIPGLNGKIFLYNPVEAEEDLLFDRTADHPEQWSTVVSLPVDETVLHVARTPQHFNEETGIAEGDVSYYALTERGKIFSFAWEKISLVSELEDFDPIKARGFFIRNNQFVVVLAGENQQQYLQIPIP